METNELDIKVFRLDDIPLIYSIIQQTNMISIIDNHLPVHGLHQGLSNGNLIAVWICHILTTGNHAKIHVRQWSIANRNLLEILTGEKIRDAEFDDSRLSTLLTHLSDEDVKAKIEQDFFNTNIYIYDFKTINEVADMDTQPDILPCAHIDTTTSYGFHTNKEGIMQLGHSKDHRPDLRQIKLLAVAIQGKLLHHKTYAGNQADDGVYYPAIEDTQKVINKNGVLYVGDSKISAMETRAKIAANGDYYLTHLPQNKGNKEFIASCIEHVISSEEQISELVYKSDILIGGGYQTERGLEYLFDGNKSAHQWTEQVLVFRSLSHLSSIANNLEKNLKNATDAILKLTPQPGKGKRQITTEADLEQGILDICTDNDVITLIDVSWEKQIQTTTKYVGRGRGVKDRQTQTIEKIRYQITGATVNRQNVKERLIRSGWVVYVSNISKKIVNLSNAVLTYRENYHLEHKFHTLKDSPLSISPLFVHNDDQIRGLTNLLMLAICVIDYTEATINQQIAKQKSPLKGVYRGLPNKLFYTVTALTLFNFFSESQITLTIVSVNSQVIKYQIDNFNNEHIKILNLLNIPIEIYKFMLKT